MTKAAARPADQEELFTNDDFSYYVVEAYFSIGGPNASWHQISAHGINGWERWAEHPQRLRHAVPTRSLGANFYTDVLAFTNLQVAATAFRAIMTRKQEYPLRLVRMIETITRIVVLNDTNSLR